MTEDELAAIARLQREAERYAERRDLWELMERVPALLAEVRRLRESLIDERAYHMVFESLSVLSWADMPQDWLDYWREQASRSLHVATADLHAWIYDTER